MLDIDLVTGAVDGRDLSRETQRAHGFGGVDRVGARNNGPARPYERAGIRYEVDGSRTILL